MTNTMTKPPLFVQDQDSKTRVNTPPANNPLTALDRCDGVFKIERQGILDSCAAAAAVRVIMVREDKSFGNLLFCGHCFKKNEAKLREVSYRVDDQRKAPENRLIGSHN